MNAQTINLLPTDLGVKSETTKVAGVLKIVTTATGIILLVLGSMAGAYIILLSTQIAASNARQEALKASIGSLEQTEQRLVLIRDRIGKARPILQDQKTTQDLVILANFVLSLPEGVTFSEAEVVSGNIEVTFTSTNSQALAALLSNVVVNDSFEKVTLNSFSFNPVAGYLTVLGLTAREAP